MKITNINTAATLTSALLDIGIGAASSEVVIFPNYLCGGRGSTSNYGTLHFVPLFIPKGTRVAARIQAVIVSETVNISVVLNQGNSEGQPIFSACDAYGVTTASSTGTNHTPGSTGAESTAANVGSTLSRDYKAIMFGNQIGATTTNSRTIHWELIIDSIVFAEWITCTTTGEYIYGPMPAGAHSIGGLVSGEQLQIRAESSVGGDVNQVAYYCFY